MKNKPHKHAELIKAWADGYKIERKHNNSEVGWINDSHPTWNQFYKYRIKPKPKLVPFTWEDREQLRGKWVRTKDGDKEFLLDVLYNYGLEPSVFNALSFKNLLEKCEFLDGTPCGKYVESETIKDD